MGTNMSQEEINMLVKDFNDTAHNSSEYGDKVGSEFINKRTHSNVTTLYKPINFRKQNKLQYENLGVLKQIHEQFSKSLNNYLTMLLRTSIRAEVDFEFIEQISFKQYMNLGNRSCLWGVYGTSLKNADENKCFFQFDRAFCDFFIDRSFGGSSNYEQRDDYDEKKVSDIDKEISKTLFVNVLEIYEQAWKSSEIMDFNMSLLSIEDSVQNLNLGIVNSEMMFIVPINISILQKSAYSDDTETKYSTFKICIPYNVIEPVLDKLNISNMLNAYNGNDENNDIKKTIQKMSNTVEVFVGETNIAFSDLLNLSAGDILLFDKKKNDTYDVSIGGVKKYEAKPYKIHNSICVQLVK